LSELAKDLFEKMTERDPKSRYNIELIKKHDWFKGEAVDDLELIKDLEIRR
jgi:serine/threonine protein kinase